MASDLRGLWLLLDRADHDEADDPSRRSWTCPLCATKSAAERVHSPDAGQINQADIFSAASKLDTVRSIFISLSSPNRPMRNDI